MVSAYSRILRLSNINKKAHFLPINKFLIIVQEGTGSKSQMHFLSTLGPCNIREELVRDTLTP